MTILSIHLQRVCFFLRWALSQSLSTEDSLKCDRRKSPDVMDKHEQRLNPIWLLSSQGPGNLLHDSRSPCRDLVGGSNLTIDSLEGRQIRFTLIQVKSFSHTAGREKPYLRRFTASRVSTHVRLVTKV